MTPSVAKIRSNPIWQGFEATTRRLLGELGGWTQEAIDRYLVSRLENEGFRAWFGHDTPAHEVSRLLIPSDLAAHRRRLSCEIAEALSWSQVGSFDGYLANEESWEAAAERHRQIIAKYRDCSRASESE